MKYENIFLILRLDFVHIKVNKILEWNISRYTYLVIYKVSFKLMNSDLLINIWD